LDKRVAGILKDLEFLSVALKVIKKRSALLWEFDTRFACTGMYPQKHLFSKDAAV
jgi:hypothetical protein